MSPQMQSHSLHHPCNRNKFLMFPKTTAASRAPYSIPVSSSTMPPPPFVACKISAPLVSMQQTPNSPSSTQSLVAAAPPFSVAKNIGFRPTPELALLCHLFVLSMAVGAFFSVALASIPTLIAFGRLEASVKKLSKVASEEVPGTLSSLKLSSIELNDLTEQLSNVRHNIFGVRVGKKDGSTTSSRSFGKRKPAS